jgi:hypothetical protein
MQKGDLIDHKGKLVRVVSVDGDDVLVAMGGYGTAPVLMHRNDLGKKVYRPYGTGPFEGEFTATMNDNKGLVLGVIAAGAVLTGILLFSKPAGAAPEKKPEQQPPLPQPVPQPVPQPQPQAQAAPAPSPAPAPQKAPAPVPRGTSPAIPKAPPPPPPQARPSPGGSPAPGGVPGMPGIPGIPGLDQIFAAASALGIKPPVMPMHSGPLPAPMGAAVPSANIPSLQSLPASIGSGVAGTVTAGASAVGGAAPAGVLGMLEGLNPFTS